MTLRIGLIAGVVALLFACATPAAAFDAEETFKKGTFVLSGEGAYGWQFDVEQKTRVTYLEYYDVGVRFSLLPLEPLGRDHFWYGSLEMGFEPLYQKYTKPKDAFWAGLSAVSRYHFLRLGRFVPYVEIGGSAGGTDLEIREINSGIYAFALIGLAIFGVNYVCGVPMAARLQRKHEPAQPRLRSARDGGRHLVLLPLMR